jgi:hypothetical protein
MAENRITFKGVGPLTRSTVGDEVPDPNEEALSVLLHWIWSWRVQVQRLFESTKDEGSGLDAIERRKSVSKASYDEHILAVAGGNLARSIDRAVKHFPQLSIPESTREAMRLLRNLYEHWDEQRKSFQDGNAPKILSGKSFLERFPEGKPWSMVYAAEDWFLGGVVPIAALRRELESIEGQALRLEQQRNAGEKS